MYNNLPFLSNHKEHLHHTSWIEVSSNKKLRYNYNKWRFFIKAFHVHNQIYLILLNSFISTTIYITISAAC